MRIVLKFVLYGYAHIQNVTEKDIYKREGGHEYVLGRINTCTCHYIFGGT